MAADARDDRETRGTADTVRNLMASSQDAQDHEQHRMDRADAQKRATQKTHDTYGQLQHAINASMDAGHDLALSILQFQHVIAMNLIDSMFVGRWWTKQVSNK